MKILAFDTSSHICSIALLIDDKIFSQQNNVTEKQAQVILTEIDLLLKSQNTTLNQLDAIAFGCGPGSFTGARIAASIAQGLSYALKLPVIPISSLKALAYSAYLEYGWDKLIVGVDARMDEVYWGTYAVIDEVISLIGEEYIDKPENMLMPKTGEWCGVGNAWEIYQERIPYQSLQKDSARTPSARAIAHLAQIEFEAGALLQPHQALPVYLRNNVAKKASIHTR